MATSTPEAPHKTVGALLFWFSTLGGALAWILHLGIGWGVTETTCSSGHERINGMPFTYLVAADVVIPGLVALTATVTAWRIWRNSDPDARAGTDRRLGRVHLLAGVGFCANLLFVAIIVFDGVALLVFPSCLS